MVAGNACEYTDARTTENGKLESGPPSTGGHAL